jgi:hypothetical protein
MLLNVSNHLLKSWSKKQIETADKLFGRILDVPFPKIPPEADENTISGIAEKYFKICLEKLSDSNDRENAVHLMGEFTFVFALAKKLLDYGITVVASTTEKSTIEKDGKKNLRV